MVGVPYALSILAINYYLAQTETRLYLSFLLLVLAAVGLQPLWRWVHDAVDRLFYRGRYDLLLTLQQLTRRTYGLEQMPELAGSVARLLTSVLGAMECRVLLLMPEGFKDLVAQAEPAPRLSRANPVVALLQASQSPLRNANLLDVPQMRTLPASTAREIGDLGAELFVPIRTGAKELVAILAVGPKRSGRAYALDDERILMDTASHLAVNLENAYLYSIEKTLRQELVREAENRTEFLVAAAHEMRTPLTSIMASSELLAGEMPPDPADPRSELVDNIKVSADILHRRTSELLDFARMRTTSLELHPESVDIAKVSQQAVRQLEPVVRKKTQTIETEMPDSLPVVYADPPRVTQVLLNLLSNASKFSPGNVSVRLVVRQRGDDVVLSVFDRAIPLTATEREKLFQPYYLGDNPQRIATGLGLGLAISKHLVERHGGKIWVETTDSGNVFSFSLPTAQAQGRTGS